MDKNQVRARVLAFMREHHMADGGGGILAAVSGGADSVCLLFLLHSMCRELSFPLAAFHLHHGLRGKEADRDEEYVKALCETLGIPFFSAHEDVSAYARSQGLSEEEAGRILRYRHLEETADRLSFSKIATAHHRDDNAETVLLHLFRGSGLAGIGGMKPVRGNLIRPLLCLSRKEIEEYLRENAIDWCEDSTNRENTYMRNKIRNELLPWVKEHVNSRAPEHIESLSFLASMADEYFENQSARHLRAERAAGVPEHAVRLKTLRDLPEIFRLYLLRSLIGQAAGKKKDMAEIHVRAVSALADSTGRQVDLPNGLMAVRNGDYLEIRRKNETKKESGLAVEAVLPAPGEEKALIKIGGLCLEYHMLSWKKDMEIPKNQYTKWFDYDKIKGALSVRNRREGDFFELPGGGRKTLRRYMIDEKIPSEKRDELFLLAEGSHILWIIGRRMGEYYKVAESTKNILSVTVCKGEDHGGQNSCVIE